MTTRPWGNEPASPAEELKQILYFDEEENLNKFKFEKIGTFEGFTKIERACIDLKVPHPDLAPELRELILESRRLDYAGQAMISLVGLIGIPEDGPDDLWDTETAKQALHIADAMLNILSLGKPR